MQSLYILLLSTLLNNLPPQNPEKDLVDSLPDYSYTGKIYSGYLTAGKSKQFHYIFTPSQTDSMKKPIVLWLNGGPGCSSLYAWLIENGPMLLNNNRTFIENEYSWNKEANMLYLESPGDVGFSYINSDKEEDLKIDDDIIAKDHLVSLLNFFIRFPDYKKLDFYIGGEAYAGIYIPMLANEIMNFNKDVSDNNKINLKGILVGNGITDREYYGTRTTLDFAFTHHLTSYESRLDYVEFCIKNYNYEKCNEVANKAINRLNGLNIYNYLEKCDTPTTENGEIDYFSNYFLKNSWAFPNLDKLQKSMKSNPLNTKKSKVSEKDEKLSRPCVNDQPITNYLNREEVKEALHVKKEKEWELCSYQVNNRYNMQIKASLWVYPRLIKSGIKILIYNGDADMVVPYNDNIDWVEFLELDVEEEWRQWRAYNDKNNISGYIVKYKGLYFCTIKGAGQEVPRWKPKEAYYMFSHFLNDEEF